MALHKFEKKNIQTYQDSRSSCVFLLDIHAYLCWWWGLQIDVGELDSAGCAGLEICCLLCAFFYHHPYILIPSKKKKNTYSCSFIIHAYLWSLFSSFTSSSICGMSIRSTITRTGTTFSRDIHYTCRLSHALILPPGTISFIPLLLLTKKIVTIRTFRHSCLSRSIITVYRAIFFGTPPKDSHIS